VACVGGVSSFSPRCTVGRRDFSASGPSLSLSAFVRALERTVPARGAHVQGAFAESFQSAAPGAVVLWGCDGTKVCIAAPAQAVDDAAARGRAKKLRTLGAPEAPCAASTAAFDLRPAPTRLLPLAAVVAHDRERAQRAKRFPQVFNSINLDRRGPSLQLAAFNDLRGDDAAR